MVQAVWALQAVLVKKKGEYRHYLADYLVGIAIKVIFLAAMVVAYPELSPRENLARILGFLLWYFAAHVLAKMSNMMIEEATLGTLSQLLTARVSVFFQLAGLAVGEVIMSLIWIIPFAAVATLLTGSASVLGELSGGQWVKLGLTLILGLSGVMGMGLVLFGISVRFKQVGSLSEVLIFFMLFFSGFFIPVAALPPVLLAIGLGSPLSWAFGLVERVLGGEPAGMGFAAQAAVAFGWTLSGTWIARAMLRRAKRQGALTTY